jgi:hypothetical protein
MQMEVKRSGPVLLEMGDGVESTKNLSKGLVLLAF